MPKKEKHADKLPAAVELGRRGGKVGGPARAASMSDAERTASARKAGKARWSEANLHAEDEPAVAKKFRDLNP
jgi:hypothetical protein